MKQYKKINKLLKDYVMLRYDKVTEHISEKEFKDYMCNLLDSLQDANLINSYQFKFYPRIPEINLMKISLIYTIPTDERKFSIDFGI